MQIKEVKSSSSECLQVNSQELAQSRQQRVPQNYHIPCISKIQDNADEPIDDLRSPINKMQYIEKERIKKHQSGHDFIINEEKSQDIFDWMKIFKQMNLQLKKVHFLQKQVKNYWNNWNEIDKNQEQHLLLTKIFAFLLLGYFQMQMNQQASYQSQDLAFQSQHKSTFHQFCTKINELIAQMRVNMKKFKNQNYKIKLYLLLQSISNIQKKYLRELILKQRYIISLIPQLNYSQIIYLFQLNCIEVFNSLKNNYLLMKLQGQVISNYFQKIKQIQTQNYVLRSILKEKFGFQYQSLNSKNEVQQEKCKSNQKQQLLNLNHRFSQDKPGEDNKTVQGLNLEKVESKRQLSNDIEHQNKNIQQNLNEQESSPDKDEYHGDLSVVTQGILTNNDISFPAMPFLNDQHYNSALTYSSCKKTKISKRNMEKTLNQGKKELSNSYECIIEND